MAENLSGVVAAFDDSAGLGEVERDDGHDDHEVEVDTFGLPLDIPGHFTRLS